MAWCPGCSYEYVDGTEICPDCNLPLKKAPGLAELVIHEDKEWTPIRSVSNKSQAEIIKGLLESNECEVLLRESSGSMPSVIGIGGAPGSVINVLVPLEKAGIAATLLRSELNWTEDELAEYMMKHDDLGYGDFDIDDASFFRDREVLDGFRPDDDEY